MVILTYILAVYVLLTPYFCYRAIKFGMKIAQTPEKVPEDKIFTIPTPKKKPKMTPEEERKMQILSNIDNYNGTSQGQKKVEVKHG